MNILNINKYYQHTGGGDRFFMDSASILNARGHDVIPYCLSYPGNLDSEYSDYFPEGISGSELNGVGFAKKVKLFLNGIYSFDAKEGLSKILMDIKPDVAHLHVLHYTMSPSIIDVLDKNNIPIVFSLHDYRIMCAGGYLYTNGGECRRCVTGNYYNALWFKCYHNSTLKSAMGVLGNYLYEFLKIYTKVDVFTVPHNGMRDILVEHGISPSKIFLLKNPLIFNYELESAGIGDYVLFFGNLSRQKGIYTFLNAAKMLPHIRFLICGRGIELEEVNKICQSKIHNVHVDTSTRWGSGLENIIAKARIVISPSEWPTPLEYSTLEAMAMGKAVLASDIGGNREVICPSQTGELFRVGDHEDLVAKIETLFSDESLCRSLGVNAQKYVRENFSEEIYYKDVLDVFSAAIRNRESYS